jgi:NTE family protein
VTVAHVVLSGAGARFPVFVGALRALSEGGVEIAQLIGTSGGALVGAFYKAGVSLERMEQLAIETDYTEFASFGVVELALLPVRGYLNPSDKVRAFLTEQLGERTFGDLPDFAAVVSDLSSESTVICDVRATPGLLLADGVYASGAIPIVFQPLLRDGAVWVDGSIRYDFALDWPQLRDGRPVIGVKVRSPYTAPRSSSAIDIIRATVANLIDANDRKHIDDATYARYVDVQVPVGALHFRLSQDEKRALIRTGYDAVKSGLSSVLAAAKVGAP